MSTILAFKCFWLLNVVHKVWYSGVRYFDPTFFWTILSSISSFTIELRNVGGCHPCWVAQSWPFWSHCIITEILNLKTKPHGTVLEAGLFQACFVFPLIDKTWRLRQKKVMEMGNLSLKIHYANWKTKTAVFPTGNKKNLFQKLIWNIHFGSTSCPTAF